VKAPLVTFVASGSNRTPISSGERLLGRAPCHGQCHCENLHSKSNGMIGSAQDSGGVAERKGYQFW